jgi:hypothetical protein
MRKEFEMTEAQLNALLDAGKAVPYMVFGGRPPTSPRENVNNAWRALGKELGFVWDTAQPVPGKRFDFRFFTAEVLDAQEEVLRPSAGQE